MVVAVSIGEFASQLADDTASAWRKHLSAIEPVGLPALAVALRYLRQDYVRRVSCEFERLGQPGLAETVADIAAERLIDFYARGDR